MVDIPMTLLKVGDTVRAEWSDGLVLSGTYRGTERGYVILCTDDGKKVACNSNNVQFEVLVESRRSGCN